MSFTLYSLFCLSEASAQPRVAVDESRIRATLQNGSTVITIHLDSSVDHAVRGNLVLEWLDREEKSSGKINREISITPGENSVNVPLPIESPSIWERLRYSLSPDRLDTRAFSPSVGIVALPHIAGYVFELKTSYAGAPQRGSLFTVYAQAVHPVTRQPVTGVQSKAMLSIDNERIEPFKTLAVAEGLTEFVFKIPNAPENDADEEASVEVSAKLGDFGQKVSASILVPAHLSGRLQSDKPIYQPGQKLHLRATVTDAQGHAAGGAKVILRVADQDDQRVHTAHLIASRFGVVSDDWPIPGTAGLGAYQIDLTEEMEDHYVLARHVVRVSRYELPAFTVVAKPDRSAYLPNQPARVTVTANYLFGKPVPRGKVKIVRTEEPVWNSKTRTSESSDQIVSEGEADANGSFVAALDLKADQKDLAESESQRFEDLSFAAYYTDPGTRRTEQRRFGIRITREPIHVYLITSGGASSPVYVSTSYADGQPASATVEIMLQNGTTTLHTNSYGIGKVFVGNADSDDGAQITAKDDAGQTGAWKERYWPSRNKALRVDSGRTLYRSGESVTIRITGAPDSPAEQFVIVNAVNDRRAVASRVVRISNHKGEVTFPYQAEFRRTVVFAASSHFQAEDTGGSKAVIFPDGSGLNVSISPGRAEYKPGDKASVRFQVRSSDGKSVEAALGLAVVDQAVLERSRTDSDFGHRRWFECAFCPDDGEREIGGIRLNDLYALPAASPISPALDLVAEALVANARVSVESESSEDFSDAPKFRLFTKHLNQLAEVLNKNYAKSFEYPRNDPEFASILGRQWSDLRDPWGQPLSAEFGLERENFLITLHSAGPDKKRGTADDFVVATLRQSYFIPLRQLIDRALKTNDEYPGTLAELRKSLSENGLLEDSMRDGWGTPYRVSVATRGAMRNISMKSAGPDRIFDTKDDFTIANFSGPYFRREAREMAKVIFSAPQPPKTVAEFRRILQNAGIDVSQYRDAWGHPYRVSSIVASRFADRTNVKTVHVFGGHADVKTDVTPVTQQVITFSLRSSGPDGIDDTYDDFDIVRVPVVLGEKSPAVPENLARSAGPLRGTGAIKGNVVDPSHAVIVNASVTLIDAAGISYDAVTQQDGIFSFVSVPPGSYSLRASSPGFTMYQVSQIPVTAGATTTVNVELSVGSTAESVTVDASAVSVATESSQAANSGPVATPRVRDYFPETLVWMPELITDARGAASAQFPLADSVTTWTLAVFASTLDGRAAESESDLRAFQPLFLDFDPPPVLTEGDRIEIPIAVRNYLDRMQKVDLTIESNDWSVLQGSTSKHITVTANSSANTTYVVQANRSARRAPQKIIASAGRWHDAIEKSSRVHPDGQEVAQNFGDLLIEPATFDVHIPQAAIVSATEGQLSLYPNVASLLLESASAILESPNGCAEQTISAGYANLVALKFLKAAGIANARIEAVALGNVKRAMEALSGFRSDDGGVRYWGGRPPDAAVTAHALAFSVEASAVSPVEKEDLASLARWLDKHQVPDGTWLPSDFQNSNHQAVLLTSLVARSLAMAVKAGIPVLPATLTNAYHHIAQFTDQTDEPYMLAQFVLAALDSGDEALVKSSVAKLASLSRDERGGAYWDLHTNSPFYGWGMAGRYETTGLVVSALSAWRKRHTQDTALDAIIRRGSVFLLRGRDSTGGWYSTQATLRAMGALADVYSALGASTGRGGSIAVSINGRLLKTVSMPSDPQSVDPILIDVSSALLPGENRIELAPSAPGGALMHFESTHWLPWPQTKVRTSPELRLSVQFDKLSAPAGEPIRCSVKAERIGFRGYGMMLAEIGLPPGAEVDRATLESVLHDRSVGVDHYEVLPDRIVFYLWPASGGALLDFSLRMRMPIAAKSAPSVLYDYYNPEALTEVAPDAWRVR